ncbi:MAG: type-4 uracil-DNA glycosylase [Candidatus Bathyarchaeota archaeon]|nr:type-4 uracil-DNA glycosylase [Candidatus Bathyarchaeota archaeon]
MSKQELMDELVDEVGQCQRCRLWERAKKAVPGEGSLDASLMFIGEAPGYWEDVKGRPFVGAAGKLLDELLSSIDLNRGDVYIGNIIKHRPPNNRDPRRDEVEACSAYLDRQIEIVEPSIILTLGRHSARYVLSKVNVKMKGITEVRGRIYVGKPFGFPVRIMPTFHPAAALYNPEYRSALEEDFQRMKKELETLA